MREHRLLQPKRSEGRRRRPGYFQVTRPDELWHLDMTSVWVAEHGWCYLNAAIDCCTREIVGWALDVRCRAAEATAVIDQAVAERAIGSGTLTLGTDNGSAFTSRALRARLAEHGIAHRRGGYRDPESQAFIESWFSKLKQRCVWREEFETLDEARAAIGAYVERYHHRPHQGLAYRTPREVAATWQDHDDQLTQRPDLTTPTGSTPLVQVVPSVEREASAAVRRGFIGAATVCESPGGRLTATGGASAAKRLSPRSRVR